jgi:arginase
MQCYAIRCDAVNTPAHSASGNVHGMPVAFLMGLVENQKQFPSCDWLEPCLKPEDIVYIGLRDVDTAEKETIRRLGIKAFSVMSCYAMPCYCFLLLLN